MRALLIDNKVINDLKTLQEYAEQNPYTLANLEAIITKKSNPPGDNPNFVRIIPAFFRIVLTIEEHYNLRIYRHASISIFPPDIDKLPSPAHIETLLPLLGFKNDLCNCILDLEKLPAGNAAIMILEPYEP